MSNKIDVAAEVKRVWALFKEQNFRPRDADGTDFQFGTDPSLRFKTGTAMNEVTVTAWKHGRQIDVWRASTPGQMDDMLRDLDLTIAQFHSRMSRDSEDAIEPLDDSMRNYGGRQ